MSWRRTFLWTSQRARNNFLSTVQNMRAWRTNNAHSPTNLNRWSISVASPKQAGLLTTTNDIRRKNTLRYTYQAWNRDWWNSSGCWMSILRQTRCSSKRTPFRHQISGWCNPVNVNETRPFFNVISIRDYMAFRQPCGIVSRTNSELLFTWVYDDRGQLLPKLMHINS